MTLPRLGVLYDPASVQSFHLAEAGAGHWRSVWLIDRDVADPGPTLRLLQRLGPVVDITGLSSQEAAAVADPLDGVVAFDDAFLVRQAEMAAARGLAGYSPEVAARLTDKDLQRAALRDAGIECPRSVRLPGGAGRDSWEGLLAGLTGPLIVKPVSGNGSRDTFAVDSAGEAVDLMVTRAVSGPAPDMQVEERIADGWVPGTRPFGDFVTVETFASHGELSTFGVTGCIPFAEGFRLTGNFTPSAFGEAERAEAIELAEQAITALGGGTGVYHTEVKYSTDGPRVVEVNGRLGGGGVPRIAEAATGRSLLQAAALVALGEKVDVSNPTFDGVAYFHRVQPPLTAAVVESVTGLERVQRLPGVREVHLNRPPGTSVGDRFQGTRGFVYSVHGTVPDHEALWETLEKIEATVDVRYA